MNLHGIYSYETCLRLKDINDNNNKEILVKEKLISRLTEKDLYKKKLKCEKALRRATTELRNMKI